MRFRWWVRQAKQRIENGDLGEIYYGKCGWFRRKGIPAWGTWFTQKELAGGGPLIDTGVHLLDLTLWLMGNPKPVSVSGATFAAFGPQKRGLGSWGTPNFSSISAACRSVSQSEVLPMMMATRGVAVEVMRARIWRGAGGKCIRWDFQW